MKICPLSRRRELDMFILELVHVLPDMNAPSNCHTVYSKENDSPWKVGRAQTCRLGLELQARHVI
jgi:hypothetical protein